MNASEIGPVRSDPEWRVAENLVGYEEAVRVMENRVAEIEDGTAPELLWLVQHPPLYTAGTSANDADLRDTKGLPVFKTGRGGQMTWHGPGQRVIYALLDLRARGRDVRSHVCRLEEWMIRTLSEFGIRGERRQNRIGIWVASDGEVEKKIGAIGVRVRKWVTYHGLALNVAPDLKAFDGIVPCGLPDFGVTSLQDLGVRASMEDVDAAFAKHRQVLVEPSGDCSKRAGSSSFGSQAS